MAFRWDEVIESHYLETHEGLFFAVKGIIHPPERVLACLRYAPDAEGERARGGQRYRRLYHFADQEAFLRAGYPAYLAFDPAIGAVVQSVPHACVRRVYDPRKRLSELRDGVMAGDGLVADCLAFADLLHQSAGVPAAALGVSGSLLIGTQRPGSDLDLTVYGIESGRAVHAALHRFLDGEDSADLRRMDAAGTEALYAERAADTHMAFADFVSVEQGKVNQGQFRGRPYFLRFVPLPEESPERYGDRTCVPVGQATIRATVTDAGFSIFTPCRYALADVQFEAGRPVDSLREIVSFRGRFCEQARTGDRIRARGTVELVSERDGTAWHRLVLGNAVEDTMLPSEVRGD